jgi:AraC-like DNA-binding protein
MHRARELLETTALPITEIAVQVGYDDPGYLARLFRKQFGMTPTAYRRERRN